MPWSTDDIKRLVEVEAQLQDVDPHLALAVAERESGFKPDLTSKAGAYGVMQLMPGTAQQLKVNAQDVGQNIEGGLRYLKQQLDAHGGDPRLALAAYNAGPGAVKQHGGVPPYKETQSYVSWIMNKLGPSSAEAATPQGATRSRLEEIDAELARRDAQPPAGATTTPAPVSQTTPTPPAQPGASQGPPGASPADEQYAAQTMAQMRQRQTPRVPVTDPAALLAVGGGPTTPKPVPAPVTDSAALLAVGGGQAPVPQTREQQIMDAARARQQREGTPRVPLPPGVPTVEQETLQEGITAPATMIPLAIGGIGGAAGRAVGTALRPYVAPWLGRAAGAIPTLSEAAGNYASRWLNVQLGYEEPGTVGDVVSVTLPLSQRLLGAGARAVTRNLPGAGVVRHEMGEQALAGLGTRLRPRTDADTLFAQAATHNPDIATADMWRTAGGIVRGERRWGPRLRATESLGVAEEVLDLARTHGGPVPLARLEELRQRVGALMGDATGRNRDNLSNLYRSIMSDLESAAHRNVPGAELLRGALQTRRLEHGLDTLTDLWSPGKGIQLEQGDITRVYGRRIQNQFNKRLQEDRLFAGSFTPEEIADIQTTLREVARLTARSPVAAPGGLLKHALSASLGTATGITSGPVTGLMVAAGVEAFPRMMAAGMRSPQGRAAIRRAFEEGGGQLTAAGYGLINQAIRDAASVESTTATPPASPGPGR